MAYGTTGWSSITMPINSATGTYVGRNASISFNAYKVTGLNTLRIRVNGTGASVANNAYFKMAFGGVDSASTLVSTDGGWFTVTANIAGLSNGSLYNGIPQFSGVTGGGFVDVIFVESFMEP